MENVLIVIHLLVVIALVVVVLLQRSEGGGLGIGGGGGGGGLMSARGTADTLTRTTAILAAVFFITSISLGVLARYGDDPTSILDQITNDGGVSTQEGVPTEGGILDSLGGAPETTAPDTPAVPTE